MTSTRNTGLVCASILAASAALLPIGEARAQTTFGVIQAFGDSYADTGNLWILGSPTRCSIPPAASAAAPISSIRPRRCWEFRKTTSPSAAPRPDQRRPGFPDSRRTAAFLASGKTIAPSDLVEISIGGNDARGYYQAGGTLAGVNAAATVAPPALTGLNKLVAAGARTSSSRPATSASCRNAVPPSRRGTVGSAYSQNYNAQMQMALANIARSGVRVEYVDNTLLGIRSRPIPRATALRMSAHARWPASETPRCRTSTCSISTASI